MTKFTEFFSDDAGAVILDWITITAGIMLLGIMVLYAIFNGGMTKLVPNVNASLGGEPTTVVVGEINLK